MAQEHGLRELSEYNAMLNAIGAGATLRNEIALQTGLAQTFAFRTRLDKLVELGLVEASRNFEASASEPFRYRVSDPALRFYYGIVARRTDGAMLTGAVKWNSKPAGISLHRKHLDMLERLAQSGYGWAREALTPGAVLLYIAADGFDSTFVEQAQANGLRVAAWSLADLYKYQ